MEILGFGFIVFCLAGLVWSFYFSWRRRQAYYHEIEKIEEWSRQEKIKLEERRQLRMHYVWLHQESAAYFKAYFIDEWPDGVPPPVPDHVQRFWGDMDNWTERLHNLPGVNPPPKP